MLLCCRLFFVLLLTGFGVSHASDQDGLMSNVLEMEKTPRMIELAVEFDTCPGKFTLKIQDGAMGVLATEGMEPIRFVVKIDDDANIKWHPISSRQVEGPQGKSQILYAKRPVSVIQSVGIDDLHRAGIKSVRYLTHYAKLPAQDAPNPSSSKTAANPEPQVIPTACCSFKGCGGKLWSFCTSGGGCGGDDCGFCCVNGGFFPR